METSVRFKKMRGDLCRPQGVMTCRGGFQTRPCGVHHASKSNAADDEKAPRFVGGVNATAFPGSAQIGPRLKIGAALDERIEPFGIAQQHAVGNHPVLVLSERVPSEAVRDQLQPTRNRVLIVDPLAVTSFSRKNAALWRATDSDSARSARALPAYPAASNRATSCQWRDSRSPPAALLTAEHVYGGRLFPECTFGQHDRR